MDAIKVSLNDIFEVSEKALEKAGAQKAAARSVSKSIMAAERDGISSHGLAYLPIYCEHLRCGKVSSTAVPEITTAGAVVAVDAQEGFAHPAIERGIEAMVPLVREFGVATLTVRNSYNCGVLGYHTAMIAERGFVGLGFTNSPASIAPPGGSRPVVGTNPWSVAAPASDGSIAILIDQSASVIAKSEVMKRARLGEPIPSHWAFDAEGHPTTDAEAALKGTMAPAGGYKGFGSGLLVEIFAACLTGATLGVSAAPFSGTAGGPPRTGQFFFAVNPQLTAKGGFEQNLVGLVQAIDSQPQSRRPGARRTQAALDAQRNGVLVEVSLYGRIKALT